MYWLIELKCRKFIRTMLYYIAFHEWTFVAALIYAIYSICTGNTDTSTWNLPLNLIVPFNTQPIWGWYLKWFFELSSGFAYALCNIIPTTYFVCSCLYIVAICNHFEMVIESIGHEVGPIQNEESQENHQEKAFVQENLLKSIHIHVNVLE